MWKEIEQGKGLKETYINFFQYLFIWLGWVLVVACRIFKHCYSICGI